MNEKKEKTACVSSAATDEKQSTQISNYRIPEKAENFNDFPQLTSFQRRMMDTERLSTVTMSELYSRVYYRQPPLVEGLLYPGLYIFAGAPKVGKSFLMMQLAYHVSRGIDIWGYRVNKGTVLYLSLEDTPGRLQERLYRMFGVEESEDLFFSMNANTMESGLMTQLGNFVDEHESMRVVIIDTLQKVREKDGAQFSYANDYDVVALLKAFADKYNICMILVHHTRKQDADDKFDMISGTNGIFGAADGAFVLHKSKRTENEAVLEVSGRDQQDMRLMLKRDTDTLKWDLTEVDSELWEEAADPILDKVAGFINEENPRWSGTATELVNALDVDLKPNHLTSKLNVHAAALVNKFNIIYNNTRNHSGRKICLTYIKDRE